MTKLLHQALKIFCHLNKRLTNVTKIVFAAKNKSDVLHIFNNNFFFCIFSLHENNCDQKVFDNLLTPASSQDMSLCFRTFPSRWLVTSG